jgi:hypothetical protein
MLGRKPNHPFYEQVMAATPEKAVLFIENHKDDVGPVQMGVMMGMLIFSIASHLLTPPEEFKDAIKLHPDVWAFEAAIFSAYAVRAAFDGVGLKDEDGDEEEDDPAMREAWQYAYAFISSVADRSCGWDTDAIRTRRLLRYMHFRDIRKATEDFVLTLQEVRDADKPQPKYVGPLSLDLMQTLALQGTVLPFVASMPPSAAQSIRNAATFLGFGKVATTGHSGGAAPSLRPR